MGETINVGSVRGSYRCQSVIHLSQMSLSEFLCRAVANRKSVGHKAEHLLLRNRSEVMVVWLLSLRGTLTLMFLCWQPNVIQNNHSTVSIFFSLFFI